MCTPIPNIDHDDPSELPDNAICYLSSARGQYIPQNFFEDTKPECINWDCSLSSKDWVLNSCASPDEEDYWEAWMFAEDNITVTNPDTGVVCYIEHREDLWLIPINDTEIAEVNKCHD